MAKKTLQLIHPRAKYRIGPGGLLFFLITSLILGASIYVQTPLLFWAFGLMVGGLLVSFFLPWLTMRHLQVERVLPSHGVANEQMIIRYRVVNKKHFMPAFGVVIHESWGKGANGWKRTGPIAEANPQLRARPFGWILHLGNNQTAQAEAPTWPTRRGRLAFEKIVLSTSFPFGIIRRILVFDQPSEVLIYPHLYRMNQRLLLSLSDSNPHGRKKLERSGGQEDFLGLREYRPGDTLKLIDWKHTAKTGKLVTRELSQPSIPKMMLLLDLTSKPKSPAKHKTLNYLKKMLHLTKASDDNEHEMLVERAISLAASLVCEAYLRRYQIGLIVAGAPCTPFPIHHSLPHRTKMLEALAQVNTQLGIDVKPVVFQTPTVIIHIGNPSDCGGNEIQAPSMISAQDIDPFIVDHQANAEMILSRNTEGLSKRVELQTSE